MDSQALIKAARFGALVLRECRDELADLDGGWLQETAQKCGLLHAVEMSAPCGEDCRCAEYDDEWPTECLRMTDEFLALEKEIMSD